MDYHEDIESSGHNLQSGAVFICQLARAGRKNVAKTHRLLKVGIAMLIVALVLYMVGFLSPYWVVGDTHGHGAPVGNATKGFRWSNFSHNDSHFGVWQECMLIDGESVCTMFTEDIDSVIIMFGCVGAFILFNMCCWACVSCLRKPRKHRYLMTVVAAFIGGVFGLVAFFIFLSAEVGKTYSWAFGLFLTSCILELVAALLILWGVTLATAEGAFPEADEEEDLTTTTTSSIVVAGSTPQKKSRKRSLHAEEADTPGRAILVLSSEGEEDEDGEDCAVQGGVPGVQAGRTFATGEGRGRGRGRKGKKKRVRKAGSRPGGGQTPVEALARSVAEQQLSFVHVSEHQPCCGTRPDSKPAAASVTGGTSGETSAKHPDDEPASAHDDPTPASASTSTAPSLQAPPAEASASEASGAVAPAKHQERRAEFQYTDAALPQPDAPRRDGRPEASENAQRSSSSRNDSMCARGPAAPERQTAHDWLPSASSFSPNLSTTSAPPLCLAVNVHNPFAITEALEALDNPEEECPASNAALGSRKTPSRDEELRSLAPAQAELIAALTERRSESVLIPDTAEHNAGGSAALGPRPRSERGQKHREVWRSGRSRNVTGTEEGDDSGYVPYSPDTSYDPHSPDTSYQNRSSS